MAKQTIKTKRVSFDKCVNFAVHPLVREIYMANLNRRKQYDFSMMHEKHVKQVLQDLPISVLSTKKNSFQFFTAFEAIIIASLFPTIEMRLDIFEEISDDLILKKSWHSLSTRFAFESHKDFGLADNFDLLKSTKNKTIEADTLLNTNLTETNFSLFASETKKAIINQRTETKQEIHSRLTSKNIRGTNI